MIKFGVFGTDGEAGRLVEVLKTTHGVRLVEYMGNELVPADLDAIGFTYTGPESLARIESSLKNFKHVYLSNTDKLPFIDFQQLLKIAEESNVRFYTDFESSTCFVKKKIGKYLNSDTNYIDIKQKVNSDGILLNDSQLKALLLRNIDIILSVTRANVRKISANLWPMAAEGMAFVHVSLEFDNGTIATINIFNNQPDSFHQLDLYTPSECVSVKMEVASITIGVFNNNASKPLFHTAEYGNTEALKMNVGSFLESLEGKLPGFIDIDNKYNTLRICNNVYAKLISNFPQLS